MSNVSYMNLVIIDVFPTEAFPKNTSLNLFAVVACAKSLLIVRMLLTCQSSVVLSFCFNEFFEFFSRRRPLFKIESFKNTSIYRATQTRHCDDELASNSFKQRSTCSNFLRTRFL